MRAGERKDVTKLEGLTNDSRDYLMTERDKQRRTSPGFTDSLGISTEKKAFQQRDIRNYHQSVNNDVNTFAAHVNHVNERRESAVAVLSAMRDTDEIEKEREQIRQEIQKRGSVSMATSDSEFQERQISQNDLPQMQWKTASHEESDSEISVEVDLKMTKLRSSDRNEEHGLASTN